MEGREREGFSVDSQQGQGMGLSAVNHYLVCKKMGGGEG